MHHKLIKAPLRNVEQGNESFIPDEPGSYLLCGPAILSSIALTYGGTGGITMYDTNVLEKEDGLYFDDLEATPIFTSHPVQVGFYSVNGGVMKNLVVHLSGGQMEIVPTANIYYKPLSGKKYG